MKGVLIGLGIFVGVLFLCGVILFFSVMGQNNEWVGLEEGVVTQYKQNQNNYDNYWKKIKEIAQVPEMYTTDLKKVYDSAIQGRYGNDKNLMFKFVKEHNPSFDSSLYTKIQQVIEAGRNSFEADQKTLLDKKRVYQISLKKFPNSMIAGFMGFPKIDLTKYDIVTSEETNKAFETKKADYIRIK